MKYLLDTNICSAVIRAKDESLLPRTLRNWGESAISAITAHELEMWLTATGPQRSQRIRGLLGALTIHPFDTTAAASAAKVRAATLARPLAAYDALIAGHALALGCVLVTADADFKRVPGLRTENWLKT